MSWIDLLLVLAALSYVWGGFQVGLIQSIGGVVGLFVGEIVASRWYGHYASVVSPLFGGNIIAGKILSFILIFLIVTRVVAIIFWLVNKMFNLIAIVPGLKLVNKIGGAIFGFIEASLFLGIILQFAVHLPLAGSTAKVIHESQLANYFLKVSGWLVPLFPKVLSQAEDATKTLFTK